VAVGDNKKVHETSKKEFRPLQVKVDDKPKKPPTTAKASSTM